MIHDNLTNDTTTSAPSRETPGAAILSNPTFAHCLPSTFALGFATASYQIEGGHDSDGKLPSNWDQFLQGKPDNGEVANDSYHRMAEDIKCLKEYGANAYRFSVSWPRVVPKGGRDDPINEKGMQYYSDLVDALLAANITPWVTLYHWDHPSALDERYGGWKNRSEMIKDFEAYSRKVFERLGDRVKNWITFNEPHIFTMLNTVALQQPNWDVAVDPYKLGKTIILAHASAYRLYKNEFASKQGGTIGLTLDCDWIEPLNDSQEAKEAAQFGLDYCFGWFADPVYLGKFPESLAKRYTEAAEEFTFTDEEWKLVKGSSDFFGLNTYGTGYATGKMYPKGEGNLFQILFGDIERVFEKDGKVIGVRGHNGHPYTVPWGFRKLLQYIDHRYTRALGLSINITENGFAVSNEHEKTVEQIINDDARQAYYASYIGELLKAVTEDGIKMGSYFGWSLADNLEWIHGYNPRMGVTYIDRANDLCRTPKKSAFMLRDIFQYVGQK